MLIKITRWNGGESGFPSGTLTDGERKFVEENLGNVFRATQDGEYYVLYLNGDTPARVHALDTEEVDELEVGWRMDGEANFATFSNVKQGWVGRMQFNGHMGYEEQMATCRKLAVTFTKVARGEI